jgi:hypothetical protein
MKEDINSIKIDYIYFFISFRLSPAIVTMNRCSGLFRRGATLSRSQKRMCYIVPPPLQIEPEKPIQINEDLEKINKKLGKVSNEVGWIWVFSILTLVATTLR